MKRAENETGSRRRTLARKVRGEIAYMDRWLRGYGWTEVGCYEAHRRWTYIGQEAVLTIEFVVGLRQHYQRGFFTVMDRRGNVPRVVTFGPSPKAARRWLIDNQEEWRG